MDARKLGGIIVTLLIAGGIVWYMNRAHKDPSATVRADILRALSAMPEYAKDQALLDAWAKGAHDAAFAVAYTSSTRYTLERFDTDAYVKTFFGVMVSQAQALGRRDLEQALRTVHAEFDNARRSEGRLD